jgi:hypothetical protein
MQIDMKLLDICPVLTDYEKDLIRHIDLNNEAQSRVAKSCGKTPSTISTQHKKSLEKFAKWIQSAEKQEKARRVEDFDRKVFHCFLKGMSPAQVIEKFGSAERVIKLWEKYRQLMQDDYLKAIDSLAGYGFEIDRNSEYPLSDELDNVLADNWSIVEERKRTWEFIRNNEISNELGIIRCKSLYDAVETLAKCIECAIAKGAEANSRLESALDLARQNIECVEALKQENRELSKLRKYEALSEEQLQQKEGKIRELNSKIESLKSLLSDLKMQIDLEKRNILELNTKIREEAKKYLSTMDHKDIWKLVIEAKWGKTNPLMASVLSSNL